MGDCPNCFGRGTPAVRGMASFLVLTFDNNRDIVVVDHRHHEPTTPSRPSPRYSRPTDSTNPSSRADAWLGCLRADSTDFAGSSEGESRLALPPPTSS